MISNAKENWNVMMRKRGKCENRNRFFSLVATFYCIFHSRKINVAYNVHVIHTLISKDVRIFQNIWFRDNFIFWNVVPRIFSIEIIQVYFPNKNVHHVVIYEWRINNVKPTNRNFLIPSTFNKCYHIARNEQDMKGCVYVYIWCDWLYEVLCPFFSIKKRNDVEMQVLTCVSIAKLKSNILFIHFGKREKTISPINRQWTFYRMKITKMDFSFRLNEWWVWFNLRFWFVLDLYSRFKL